MENKFKKIWVHEAYKNVGTSNWTVREQDEKPPKPTAYENDWNDYVPASALESANAELENKYKEVIDDIRENENRNHEIGTARSEYIAKLKEELERLKK